MRQLAIVCLSALVGVGAAGCRGCSDAPRGRADIALSDPADAAPAPEPPDTAPAADAWHKVAPDGAGFTAEFPEPPEHLVQTLSSATGIEAELNQYKLAEELTGRMMMVSYNPLVGQLVDFGDPDAALARLVADQKSGPRRTLVSERALTLDGHKGHELIMISEDLGNDKMRITWGVFIVGYRLYQLMATANDDASQARADRFLDAFRFTPDAAGPQADAAKRDLWQKHESEAGDFTVTLPAKPELEVTAAETPWGRREVRRLTVLSAFPPALYTLTVIPLAPSEQKLSLTESLGAWEALTLKGRGDVTLALKQRAAVVIAGHTARVLEVTATRPDGDVSARFLGLPFGDRFFELGFLPLDARAGALEASRFFDGFTPHVAAEPPGAPQ